MLVCPGCDEHAMATPKSLLCPLCEEGYMPPTAVVDLVEQKRKLGVLVEDPRDAKAKKSKTGVRMPPAASKRLFIGNLPLSISAKKLRKALHLPSDSVIVWITDHTTSRFYGSAFVGCQSESEASAVHVHASEGKLKQYLTMVEDGKPAQEIAKALNLELKAVKALMKGEAEREGIAGIKLARKRSRIRVEYAPLRPGEVWPPEEHVPTEYPPLGD